MEKISVTILTKNSQKYLKKCIDSVLIQKYPDFEIIIVDSCSTDNTISILDSYKDPRINVIKSNKNLLIGNARQICVNNSTGEILAIVDSDVELPHEHWLENMYKALCESPDIAGVQTLAKAKDSDPEILKRIHGRFEYKNRIIGKDNYQQIGTSHLLLKKYILEKVGGFPDVFHAEDVVVMRKIMNLGYKFIYLKEEKCYHYHVEDNMSNIKKRLKVIFWQIKDMLFRGRFNWG